MKCLVCNTNCEGEYCFRHKPRKPLNKSGLKPTLSQKTRLNVGKSQLKRVSDKKKIKNKKDAEDTKIMFDFFMTLWSKSNKKSEISGTYLGKEASSAFFHHILPKSKYPEARLDPENIIILTIDEHNNVENDMYKYDIINKRRLTLLNKYQN